jgi:hypothetical protein
MHNNSSLVRVASCHSAIGSILVQLFILALFFARPYHPFYIDADPDPTVYFDADPDPATHQSDTNL